ncbi:MAG TPA: hypothetical protein VKX24_06875 [Acidimicrobiia bacterium]|nr:hypothetical protein [Acidimicrobiia bacterium]
MYKASLGLVGVAAVALIYGWVRQSNPATWFSIVAAIVAGLLLVASWLLERVRGGGADFSPSGAADASGGGTWTAPAPSSSAWSPAGSSSPSRRSPAEEFTPDFDSADDGPRGASASASSAPAQFAPGLYEPAPGLYEPEATMAMPPAEVEESKRRFGRKASAPSAPATSAVDERVAELRALSESTSAELFSFTEEDESTESRLARAQQEAEDLLAQPVESFRAPEPARPAAPPPPPPPVAAPRAPEPMRGAPSHEQDEWLQAAMRRREARRAATGSGDAAGIASRGPDADEPDASVPSSIAPAGGPAPAWTPPPGAPPPGRAAAPPAAPPAARPAAAAPAPTASVAAPPAPATAPAAPAPARPGVEEEGEALTWSQRRRRTRLGAEPAPDYELREVPSSPVPSRRRSRAEEPDEEADFELIPVPGEELPEELPEELAVEEEEEEVEEPQEVAARPPSWSRRTASSFAGEAPASGGRSPAPAKAAGRRAPAPSAAKAAPAKAPPAAKAAPAKAKAAAAKPAANAAARTAPAKAPAKVAPKAAAKAAPAKAAPAKAPAKSAVKAAAKAPAKAPARASAAAKPPAQEEQAAPSRRKWPTVLG